MANPGPATTVTVNTQAVTAPIQTPSTNTVAGPVQGANNYRLIASARALNLGTAGDMAVVPVVNSTYYQVTDVVVANGQVSGAAAAITTAAIGIYTASAAGGTSIVAAAALATNSAANQVATMTVYAATGKLALTNTQMYFYVSTTLANATCDVFVYGRDLV